MDDPVGHNTKVEQPDVIDVLVVMKQSALGPNGKFDRGAECRVLLKEAHHARERIIEWLKDHSLWSEVKEVGEINTFNLIPLARSERVVAALKNAPDVEAVVPADIPLDLIQ